jgi:hypothetical protein
VSKSFISLFNRIDYKQVTLLSSLLIVMFFDHITTLIGLSNGLYETNLNVVFLINNGLWFITDLIVTIIMFIIPLLLSSYFDPSSKKIIQLFPVIAITIRLSVCFNNVALLLTI